MSPEIDTFVRNNDTWLAHLSCQGSEQKQALSELRDSLLRGLRHALRDRQSVNEDFFEDVVQDALLLILERLHQFEGRSQFLTWATSIAIHVAMSRLRRKHWKDISLDKLVEDGDFSLESNLVKTHGPESEMDRESLVNKMHTLMQSELTEKQRRVLIAELKGMPQEEIARHFGSNRNAIYKLTHDARKRLKQGLEAAGYKATDISAAFTTA